MVAIFANNATGKLGGDITTSSTTLILQTGNGALFPSPTEGDYFPITVVKSDGTLEIMKCTARSVDTLTVTRSQEGTTAKAFTIGDRVSLRMTAGSLVDFVSNKQPLDTTLTALSGLVTAADKIIYATGVDAFAVTPLTSFARSLLDDADASAMRTTLGAISSTGSITGNAATADLLKTVRAINGVLFDGSANIDVDPYVESTAVAGSYYVAFASSITNGFQRLKINTGMTYNPSTNLLSVSVTSDINDVGKVCAFARNLAPSGYLKCNGAEISRTTYAALFAAIGTRFGAGDGSTTFNVPDLRGEFIRGWDDARGVDSSRVLGSWQDGQNLWHGHGITINGYSHNHWWGATTSTNGNHQHGTGMYSAAMGNGSSLDLDEVKGNGGGGGYATSWNGNHTHDVSGWTSTDSHGHSASIDGSGGNEVRVRNCALLYCIKY